MLKVTNRKNQKGFTLVEVIVVAVIVAVLAAVAVPLYMGYIRDARTNVCQNTAGSIAGAYAAAVQQGSTPEEDWVNEQKVTIPGLSGTDNTFTVPDDYTVVVDLVEKTVIVTGPGESTSTAVSYGTP